MPRANRPPIEPELIGFTDLCALLGHCSRNWVYDQMRRDSAFPRPLKINGATNTWRLREVRAYLDAIPHHELTGLSAIDAHALRAQGGAA